MDFVRIPVFCQSVKPGLGLRFRGSYWAFFDKRTELSPWLVLHRKLGSLVNSDQGVPIKDLLTLKISPAPQLSGQIYYLKAGNYEPR